MHDLPFPLDASAHARHSGAEHRPAVSLEHLRPDDEVRDARLVLDRDEHDALGGPRPLTDEHEARNLNPASVPRGHRLGAGDVTAASKLGPEGRDRMLAERQADVAVVLDHLAALRHGAQPNNGLDLLGYCCRLPVGGGGEEREWLVA